MKQNWTYKKFEDCLDKVKYTPKVPSSDYMDDGAFPIISQEEGLISGYWNKETDVFKVLKPVVIFGDHTRILKYVDFDFVLGADGVKILQPIEGLSAKFLLYYLIWCNIPSMGYSRHYKLLKELDIPVPAIETQSRIVSELDLLQSIIDKQQVQLKELDKLAQAVFYDMFGDPVENEKGWEVKRFDAIGEIVSGSTPSTTDESNWDGNVNWITPAEMGVQLYYGETQRKITEKAAKRLTIMPVGTVLLSSRAPIGKLAIASVPMCCNQGFKNIICGKSVINVFLYYYLMLTMDNVLALGRGATFKEISKQAISAYTAIVPPLPLQQSFAAKIESIEKQKAAISQSIAETQKLFDYTMDKYFG